jgi:hypothetical protein
LAAGSNTTVQKQYITKGAVNHNFATNTVSTNVQFVVSHTASAVNYVQVTGGATGNPGSVTISAQGSDANVNMIFGRKGSGQFQFQGPVWAATNSVNYITLTGAASGSAPTISVASGTDADIDLTLTPKGAGAVRFGTYTGTILTPTGYITVKDSGGTTRRLLVG